VQASPAQLFAIAYRLGADATGEAERAVDAWIRGASVREIVRLAAEARTSFRSGVWATHVRLDEPLDASLLTQIAPRSPASVGALLSVHRSGYVRELGLTALAASDEPRSVPFLLLRTDDIVPALRDLASRAIEARLRPQLAPAFARSLGLVDVLRRRSRGGGGLVVQSVHGLLCRPPCAAALAAASDDPDPGVRLASLRLRLRTESAVSVLARAMHDRDTRVRLWAARTTASRATTDDERRALLPLLEASGSAWTRSLALRARQHLDTSDAPIEAALLDPSGAVRHLARTLLRARHPDRQLGSTRSRALAALSRPGARTAELVGALGALADVGLPADAEHAARFDSDPRPRVRAEAARTLALLRA
jgi:hypothetical protein